MSRATAAAPRSNASEAAAGRQPTRQSRPTPDCRAATSKPLSPPLHDNQTATIMPVPRHQIPILIVARFLSRLPRYSGRLAASEIEEAVIKILADALTSPAKLVE